MKRVAICVALALATASPAFAHHEAMFGPQSSAVLSPGIFVSALVFDKETGKGDQERRETTTVYSLGFKPVKNQPLSMAFVVPMTFAGGAPDPNSPGAKPHGFEDMLVFDISSTVQAFTLVSLPLTQTYNSIVDRQRFRFGTGIIWILKHSGS